MRREDAVLLGHRQPGVEWDDLISQPSGPFRASQCLGGVADLALPGAENEDVARSLSGQLAYRLDDRLWLVELARQRIRRREPAGDSGALPGTSARHLDDRNALPGSETACEMGGETLGVDRRRCDDHLQVRPSGQQLRQVAEQQVDVEAALVRLVDDERVVAAQQAVVSDFGQQDAVRHDLHERPVAERCR